MFRISTADCDQRASHLDLWKFDLSVNRSLMNVLTVAPERKGLPRLELGSEERFQSSMAFSGFLKVLIIGFEQVQLAHLQFNFN